MPFIHVTNMSNEANRYSVAIRNLTAEGAAPAVLETKAHTIDLAPDGTLTVIGEKQRRISIPGNWDSYEVRCL